MGMYRAILRALMGATEQHNNITTEQRVYQEYLCQRKN